MRAYFFLAIIAAGLALAQSPSPTRPDFGEKLRQNTKDLEQYSYKRSVEISVKGRTSQRTELVRYVDGRMETVPLDSPQRPSGQGHGRGLRGAMARKKVEKKKEEMKEDVEKLRSLLKSYMPGSDAMRRALENASISRTNSASETTIVVEARNILTPDDSVRLSWNVESRRPDRMEVHAFMDKKPVQLTIEYASLPQGPFYAAHTEISAPARDLRVKIDTYDYAPSDAR